MNVDEKFDILYLDPSGMCAFKRCPFKYMLSRLMGLSSPNRSMIALDYGTAMHTALPKCVKGDLSGAIAAFDDVWSNMSYGMDDSKRNKLTARASIENFYEVRCKGACRMYEPIDLPITAPVDGSIDEGEVPFLTDIGATLPLAGRIDMPVKMIKTGRVWALDFKTSSEVSSRYFNGFHRSPASIAYTLVLTQLLQKRAEGLIVEAIRTSQKNVECLNAFCQVPDHFIFEFERQFRHTAAAILICNDHKEWPRNYVGCSPYSAHGTPGYNCEFSTLCDLPDWKEGLRFFERGEPFHPFKIKKG